VKNEAESLVERIFKALFNILTDLPRNLSEENKTISLAYKRALKSRENRDEHMRQLP
jgi:hypothetical protein